MSKIGYLNKSLDGPYEELHGEISTLQMQLKIKLIESTKSSDNAPNYSVFAIGHNGQDIQIGGAWKKKKQQAIGNDLEFLSITIDDHSLPSAMNVAAFKNTQDGWDITWRRRQSSQ